MTKLLSLLLGIGTVLTGSIIGSSGWLAGSQIIEGNTFYDTTNNATPKVYIGTSQLVGMTAGGFQFTTNGTQSGVVLKDSTTTAFASYTVACTATGGNVKVSG